MTWAPDYATVSALRDYLRIADAADDVFLGAWVTAVSRNIDDHCGRQFGQTAGLEARTYPVTYDRVTGENWAMIDDVQDVSGLVVTQSAATVLAANYKLYPLNAVQKGRPYERITVPSAAADITMTARWGWTAVPAAVPTALYLQGARLAARRDSPFGIAGSPSEGSELRLLAQLDPDFRMTLKPFRRKWWAA